MVWGSQLLSGGKLTRPTNPGKPGFSSPPDLGAGVSPSHFPVKTECQAASWHSVPPALKPPGKDGLHVRKEVRKKTGGGVEGNRRDPGERRGAVLRVGKGWGSRGLGAGPRPSAAGRGSFHIVLLSAPVTSSAMLKGHWPRSAAQRRLPPRHRPSSPAWTPLSHLVGTQEASL